MKYQKYFCNICQSLLEKNRVMPFNNTGLLKFRSNYLHTSTNKQSFRRYKSNIKILKIDGGKSSNITTSKDSDTYLNKNYNNKVENSNLQFSENDVNERNILMPLITDSEDLCQENTTYPRISDLNIQMLSENLHDQLFKNHEDVRVPSAEDIDKSISHLKQNDLWGNKPTISPDIKFKLPLLKGKTLMDHFYKLGDMQSAYYKALITKLIGCKVPKIPSEFSYTKGWTKYVDGKMQKVSFPDCPVLVFDIEVCMSEGQHPTLACAVSDKYWYSWCSRSLIDRVPPQNSNRYSLEDLIPFNTLKSSEEYLQNCDKHKIIIGHNVSFDRLAVREEYYLEKSKMRFLDTMSLHIAVSGLVEDQRCIIMKNKRAEKKIRLPWMTVGCMNSLKDVYNFYCGKELDKEARDVFFSGTIEDVRADFQNLMRYCAKDVLATQSVLVKLFPTFLQRFPHPVTLAGMLEMGTTYLPVCKNWSQYISTSEEKFNDFNAKLTNELAEQALKALKLRKDEQYKSDPWLWDLDWDVPKARVKKLQGYPNWYRKLCMRTKCEENIEIPKSMSTSLKIVPKLLKLTWNGYPLHHVQAVGWGYLKPVKKYVDCKSLSSSLFPYNSLLEMTKTIPEIIDENELPGFDIGIPNVLFHPLPHKDGEGCKVGNPLSKDFLRKLEDHTLSSADNNVAELVLKTTKCISYWKNNRDRILSQVVIQLDDSHLPDIVTNSADYSKEDEYGAILPQVVTAGTITRRAVEKTWMTASNAYEDRIGSELKSMIRAPPGYTFVGADVDSQELWIASVLGDAYFGGQHGCTAVGWMTLQGSKSDGTDMHSKTAQTAGISRGDAKVINYGRIYGAGMKFIQRLLKQFNPTLTEEETKKKAFKLFAATKGEKGWRLSRQGCDLAFIIGYDYKGQALKNNEVLKLLRSGRENGQFLSKNDVIRGDPVWVGGSESHMFNCLEAIARMDEPRTPVLGARITRALEPWCVEDDFMTSRVNWVVQSSAVDYLHLMLVTMRWLFEEYNINGRFSISIHDEVRYLVASEDRYRAALALHITNLLTRSFISMKLGMNDLPLSVAFFSGVDIDSVIRKEPDMDCITPSNPDGLLQGYSIPKGETLNIYQVLEKMSGKLNSN